MADHERLDRAVDARRLDLGLSWVGLARAAGISDVSLRNFRKGRGMPSALSKRRLEAALRWTAGSIDSVLGGGDPSGLPTDSDPRVTTEDELRQLIADTEDELRWLNPRYESNRVSLTKHLQRRLDDLRAQLDALQNKG